MSSRKSPRLAALRKTVTSKRTTNKASPLEEMSLGPSAEHRERRGGEKRGDETAESPDASGLRSCKRSREDTTATIHPARRGGRKVGNPPGGTKVSSRVGLSKITRTSSRARTSSSRARTPSRTTTSTPSTDHTYPPVNSDPETDLDATLPSISVPVSTSTVDDSSTTRLQESVTPVAWSSTIRTSVDRHRQVVDLTSSIDEEFVDLTTGSSFMSEDTPVVISESPLSTSRIILDTPLSERLLDANRVLPDRSRRGNETALAPVERRGNRKRKRSGALALLLDTSDEENSDDSDCLPPVSFHVPPTLPRPLASKLDRDKVAETDGGIGCPICLESISQVKSEGGRVMSGPCGHVLCGVCMDSLLHQRGECKSQCPTCRKRLTKKSVHQIFI